MADDYSSFYGLDDNYFPMPSSAPFGVTNLPTAPAPAPAGSPSSPSPSFDFSRLVPGMIGAGTGLFANNMGQHEGAARLARAQGPLYNQDVAAASNQLAQAGNFDPQAFAADRFQKQQALLNPVYQKQTDDYMRALYAKGMLGISTYNPGVEGITPNGTAMNPHMAALFAAQNAQRAKDAAASMDAGQTYLNNLVNRSGALQRQAYGTQQAGIQGQGMIPSRTAGTQQFLGGLGRVLGDSGATKAIVGALPSIGKSISGAFGGGLDWLNKNLFDPSSTPMVGDFSTPDYSDFGDLALT